jgi:hypothetical protein
MNMMFMKSKSQNIISISSVDLELSFPINSIPMTTIAIDAKELYRSI